MSWNQRQSFFRIGLGVLGIVYLVCSIIVPVAEAKKRRSASSSAFKILEVTTSPSPFEIGNGELVFSTVVNVPKNLKGMDFLEVTILLTSLTQRSMRFLTQRVPLQTRAPGQRGSHIPTALIWDGKDQTQSLVKPGVYQYEIRAKLMAEKGAGVLARMVSRRSRGTVEVTKYHAPKLPPAVEARPQDPETGVNDSLIGEEEEITLEEIVPEGIIPEGTVESATDEVEMLPDESTSHPVPEPGEEEEEGGASEEGETLGIPQEG